MLLMSFLLLATVNLSCKEPEITGPPSPDEGDFSYPQLSFDLPTITFTTNRSHNVVYVGETFEIKVILYSMPDSLFAAGGDFIIPEGVEIMKIVPNPDYISSGLATVNLAILVDNTASFVVTYKAGHSPSTSASGVLLKLICKAISPSEITLGTSNIANPLFRVTDSGTPIGSESNNEELSPTPVVLPLIINVSDEFVGG